MSERNYGKIERLFALAAVLGSTAACGVDFGNNSASINTVPGIRTTNALNFRVAVLGHGFVLEGGIDPQNKTAEVGLLQIEITSSSTNYHGVLDAYIGPKGSEFNIK